MKISGSYEFSASPEQVWQVLTDPKVLAGCIPGCEGLEPQGNDEYQAQLTVGVGPVRGKYSAKITMKDKEPYQSYALMVQGKGVTGFVNGEAKITLVEQGDKTLVQVDSDAQAGGPIVRVGQRMMDSVARVMLNQFFTCLQKTAN
jgi:carbon monoxide dehydrogenase subunit G